QTHSPSSSEIRCVTAPAGSSFVLEARIGNCFQPISDVRLSASPFRGLLCKRRMDTLWIIATGVTYRRCSARRQTFCHLGGRSFKKSEYCAALPILRRLLALRLAQAARRVVVTPKRWYPGPTRIESTQALHPNRPRTAPLRKVCQLLWN